MKQKEFDDEDEKSVSKERSTGMMRTSLVHMSVSRWRLTWALVAHTQASLSPREEQQVEEEKQQGELEQELKREKEQQDEEEQQDEKQEQDNEEEQLDWNANQQEWHKEQLRRSNTRRCGSRMSYTWEESPERDHRK